MEAMKGRHLPFTDGHNVPCTLQWRNSPLPRLCNLLPHALILEREESGRVIHGPRSAQSITGTFVDARTHQLVIDEGKLLLEGGPLERPPGESGEVGSAFLAELPLRQAIA